MCTEPGKVYVTSVWEASQLALVICSQVHQIHFVHLTVAVLAVAHSPSARCSGQPPPVSLCTGNENVLFAAAKDNTSENALCPLSEV